MNASERRVTECLFADESALLATTRSGAESSAIGYQQTSSEFGLKLRLPQIVTGRTVEEGDQECVEEGDQECVEEGDQECVEEGDQECVEEGDQECVEEGDQECVEEGDQESVVLDGKVLR